MKWLFQEGERTLVEYVAFFGVFIVAGLMCICVILLAKGARQSGVSNAIATPAPAQSEAFGASSSSIGSPKASVGRSDMALALGPTPSSSEGLRPATAAEQISDAKQTPAALDAGATKAIQKNRQHVAGRGRGPYPTESKANLHKKLVAFQSRSPKSFKMLLITMWRNLSGKSKAVPNKSR
ncbi:MAG: hypothetical protein WB586_30685 [Chthoniobacterales bacterium]